MLKNITNLNSSLLNFVFKRETKVFTKNLAFIQAKILN